MAAAPKKSDYSDTPKRATWIRKEHVKLDIIHYIIIFTLLGGIVFFGGLLVMSYVDSTKSLVATVMNFLV
jgi:hypothetical protein